MVVPGIHLNPDQMRLWISLVNVRAKIAMGMMNMAKVWRRLNCLPPPVSLEANIKNNGDTKTIPIYDIFDQRIFSSSVVATASKNEAPAQMATSINNKVSSTAPLDLRLFQTNHATTRQSMVEMINDSE